MDNKYLQSTEQFSVPPPQQLLSSSRGVDGQFLSWQSKRALHYPAGNDNTHILPFKLAVLKRIIRGRLCGIAYIIMPSTALISDRRSRANTRLNTRTHHNTRAEKETEKNKTYQSVSGESMTSIIFAFLDLGEFCRVGKLTSSFDPSEGAVDGALL